MRLFKVLVNEVSEVKEVVNTIRFNVAIGSGMESAELRKELEDSGWTNRQSKEADLDPEREYLTVMYEKGFFMLDYTGIDV